jgi:hypothetical protein
MSSAFAAVEETANNKPAITAVYIFILVFILFQALDRSKSVPFIQTTVRRIPFQVFFPWDKMDVL